MKYIYFERMEEEHEEETSVSVDAEFVPLQVSKWNYKQKIFLIGIDESKLIADDMKIITLPTISTLGYAKYLLGRGSLFEIQRAIDEPSSWFVGDSIQNGTLSIS
jgi:hypothetical protein